MKKIKETVLFSEYLAFLNLLNFSRKEEKEIFRSLLNSLHDEIGVSLPSIVEVMELTPKFAKRQKLADVLRGTNSGNREYIALIMAGYQKFIYDDFKELIEEKAQSILKKAKKEVNNITDNLKRLEEKLHKK